MTQRWILAIAMFVGCGTDPEPRLATSDVVVLEIMKPSCGQVQCHSSTTRIEGLILDNIDDAKRTIRSPVGGRIEDALDGINGRERMPPDSPLQDADVQLIKNWIDMNLPDTLP